MCVCVCVCVSEHERELVFSYADARVPVPAWVGSSLGSQFRVRNLCYRLWLCDTAPLDDDGVEAFLACSDEPVMKKTKGVGGVRGHVEGGWRLIVQDKPSRLAMPRPTLARMAKSACGKNCHLCISGRRLLLRVQQMQPFLSSTIFPSPPVPVFFFFLMSSASMLTLAMSEIDGRDQT